MNFVVVVAVIIHSLTQDDDDVGVFVSLLLDVRLSQSTARNVVNVITYSSTTEVLHFDCV